MSEIVGHKNEEIMTKEIKVKRRIKASPADAMQTFGFAERLRAGEGLPRRPPGFTVKIEEDRPSTDRKFARVGACSTVWRD